MTLSDGKVRENARRAALPASVGDRKGVSWVTALRVQEFDKGRGPVGLRRSGRLCDLPI
jgi:hypothetical protein